MLTGVMSVVVSRTSELYHRVLVKTIRLCTQEQNIEWGEDQTKLAKGNNGAADSALNSDAADSASRTGQQALHPRSACMAATTRLSIQGNDVYHMRSHGDEAADMMLVLGNRLCA